MTSIDLGWDEEISSSFLLLEDGKIVAAGSRSFNVLKCIGVSPCHQGEGLSSKLVSLLSRDAVENGYSHLFLHTKPSKKEIFMSLGFYEVVSTEDAAILENRRNGIRSFVAGLPKAEHAKRIGCVVANCDPFTNGHLFLAKQAAMECDFIYFFVLSEQRSCFPAEKRHQLAKKALAHLPNVVVCSTGGYLVSSASFPTYFIKDKLHAGEINCELDLMLFAERFARPLRIGTRFVGTEPFCKVTNAYNMRMKALLPHYGIDVHEVERFRVDGEAVSAGKVRRLLEEGRKGEAKKLVPETSWDDLIGA